MDDDEREGLVVTATENTEQFLTAIDTNSLGTSLKESDYIPLHSTDVYEELKYEFDIDGLVIEAKSLSLLTLSLRRLHMDTERNTVPIYHKIKKHVILSNYNVDTLKKSQGLVIAYTSGYEVIIGLLPDKTRAADNILTDSKKYFERVKEKVETMLSLESGENKRRASLLKNNLRDISYWDVLTRDQSYILSIIENAVSRISLPPGMTCKFLVSQFGQKEHVPFQLENICKIEGIVSMSVHSAVNIGHDDIHIMWSREALQKLLGRRGRLYQVLSFSEIANFQTNLDGKSIDISNELRDISSLPENITFLQLYCDVPHRREHGIRPHPVSGTVVCSDLLHHKVTAKMYSDAKKYLVTVEDNMSKMIGPISGRIEIVTRTTLDDSARTARNVNICAKDFFNMPQLNALMNAYPLIVPFKETIDKDKHFIEAIRKVGIHLFKELNKIYEIFHGTGAFEASWKALQLELAIEHYLYGGTSYQPNFEREISVNLGPGGDPTDRSDTSRRGFLCLSNWNASALSESSPPPVKIYTKNKKEQVRIQRAFGFFDSLEGSFAAIGEKLILCILLDMKSSKSSEAALVTGLKQQECPNWGKIVGGVLLEDLVDQLIKQLKFFRYPSVSQRLVKFIEGKGLNLKSVLDSGLRSSSFEYFIHLRSYDTQRNERISWNNKDLIQIVKQGCNKNIEAEAAELSLVVINTMETNRYCYSTTLAPLRDADSLPWMVPMLNKLKGQNVSEDNLVKICVFITCIAMLQNAMYIEYNKLRNLHAELGSKIRVKLQRLEILSKFELPHFQEQKIFRLHSTIPFKLAQPKKQPKKQGTASFVNAAQETQMSDDEMDYEAQEDAINQITVMPNRHVPTCESRKSWTDGELKLLKRLQDDESRTVKQKYVEYIKLCRENSMPHRSLTSFRMKMYHLK